MKKTAPHEQGAAEIGVKCWKGEPGPKGVIDTNYRFKTEPLSSEDLAELLREMQESMRQALPLVLGGEDRLKEG